MFKIDCIVPCCNTHFDGFVELENDFDSEFIICPFCQNSIDVEEIKHIMNETYYKTYDIMDSVKYFTHEEMKQVFLNDVDEEQKAQGTTFFSWIAEMLKCEIFYQVAKNEYDDMTLLDSIITTLTKNDMNSTWYDIEDLKTLSSALQQAILNNIEDEEINSFYTSQLILLEK